MQTHTYVHKYLTTIIRTNLLQWKQALDKSIKCSAFFLTILYISFFPEYSNIALNGDPSIHRGQLNTKNSMLTMSSHGLDKLSTISIDHKIKLCVAKHVVLKYTKVKKMWTWKSQMYTAC